MQIIYGMFKEKMNMTRGFTLFNKCFLIKQNLIDNNYNREKRIVLFNLNIPVYYFY